VRRGLLLAGALLAAVGLTGWALWPSAPPAPDWSAEYDLTARPPDLIPPGTVVERSPPPGWSHLVIKSLPRVRPADRVKLPAVTVRMASWMFTAFLADVRPEGGRHRLRAIALGFGTSVHGRDTVITPETGKQLGADFGFLGAGREILAKAYERQKKGVVVIHGPTLGLLDTPVWFRCGETNRLVRYRYALLADAPTGRLDVLLWSLGTDDGGCGDRAEVVRIEPGTIDEAELIPDMGEFNLGVPSEAGFGVDRFPPHTERYLLPSELRALAGQTRFTPAEAHALETGLRKLGGGR
jgi:hypothetical protein